MLQGGWRFGVIVADVMSIEALYSPIMRLEWIAVCYRQSQASQVLVTHGYSQLFSQYLTEQGWDARVAETAFSDGFHEVEENQASE